MSNAEADRELVLPPDPSDLQPTFERLDPRPVLLGPRTEVRRVLPNKGRRMIGAWCFVDHYGPENITHGAGMRIAPHPHTGLQTVSWLLDGEIHHRDTLGSDVLVLPGQLNLMTSGPGIAHSEESPPGHSPVMHGVQLWAALPEGSRHDAPRDFTQYTDLPRVDVGGLAVTVIMGELAGALSPATTYSPIVGAELVVSGDAMVPLRADYEYGVLAIDEGLVVEGERLAVSEIGYVGAGRSALSVSSSDGPARGLLLGGEPFEEELVMWWNFIGRSHEEIVEFRRLWSDEDASFGRVVGYRGDRLLAPSMPNTLLKSRPRHR